jgi:hypothetical protein
MAARSSTCRKSNLGHVSGRIAADLDHWGRGLSYRLLLREDWLGKHKRVHRLWREEGLQRPMPRRQ